MSIDGRIAIDIGFTDTHTTEGVQAVQRISLASTGAHTSGKVIVVSGTITTAGEVIEFPPPFKNAAGDTVAMTQAQRIAYRSTKGSSITDGYSFTLQSFGEEFAVSGCKTAEDPEFSIAADPDTWTAGTASYTLVLYGT